MIDVFRVERASWKGEIILSNSTKSSNIERFFAFLLYLDEIKIYVFSFIYKETC
jgi:hypothetical protein